ncbi:MAG: pyridoxine 5'-phosphate synthase [Oligoflexales bacterium]
MRLGVNIDHIATLRNARGERYPSPVQAAKLAEASGADNITCHLREDRRHIKDNDVIQIKENILVPLNFEMGATDEMIKIANRVKPHVVTLVPEKRQELTTEGGLDVVRLKKDLISKVQSLRDNGIVVALFVEPSAAVVDACVEIGAAAVEFHTGGICHALEKAALTSQKTEAMTALTKAAKSAKTAGLQVHVGHGINYQNAMWIQTVPHVEEANIGHSIVSHALFVGLAQAVKEMKDLLNNPVHFPLPK